MHVDKISPQKRSLIMAAVRSKNTFPEMAVRRLVYGLGYRYRLHVKNLPGCPDLVFSSRRKVIFVHGCFWHRHARCRYATMPKTRTEFWNAKFKNNVSRDAYARKSLKQAKWSVLVVWQCELKNLEKVEKKISDFLQES